MCVKVHALVGKVLSAGQKDLLDAAIQKYEKARAVDPQWWPIREKLCAVYMWKAGASNAPNIWMDRARAELEQAKVGYRRDAHGLRFEVDKRITEHTTKARSQYVEH